VLAFHVSLVALSLRHDVELAQVVLRHLAKALFAFDLASAEFSAELQVPILGDLLDFGEALFSRARATIFAREIA
jgi:hypothetical protein